MSIRWTENTIPFNGSQHTTSYNAELGEHKAIVRPATGSGWEAIIILKGSPRIVWQHPEYHEGITDQSAEQCKRWASRALRRVGNCGDATFHATEAQCLSGFAAMVKDVTGMTPAGHEVAHLKAMAERTAAHAAAAQAQYAEALISQE